MFAGWRCGAGRSVRHVLQAGLGMAQQDGPGLTWLGLGRPVGHVSPWHALQAVVVGLDGARRG